MAQPSVSGFFVRNGSCSTAGVADSMTRPSCQQHGSPSCLPPKILPHELSTISSYRMYCTCAEKGGRRPGGGETEADVRTHKPASGIGIHTLTKACTFNCTMAVSPSEMEKSPSWFHTDSVSMNLNIVNYQGPIIGTSETFSRVHFRRLHGLKCSRPSSLNVWEKK